MKKLLPILLLLLVFGCAQDEPFIEEVSFEIPQSLKIESVSGLKIESFIVQDEVRMNVKLPYSGQYRVRLKDIKGTLVSQELITANMGDNLLKVYVSTLPKSSYTITLVDLDNKVLGVETIVVN
jgi:hypothetical protein